MIQVANPMDMVKMERANKRVKIEKRPVDERAMRNAFEKVIIIESSEYDEYDQTQLTHFHLTN